MMKLKAPIILTAVFWVLGIAPVLSHDTWLIPARFQIAPGEAVTLDLTSGMEFPKLDVAPKPDRIGPMVCWLAGRTFDVTDRAAAPNSLQIKTTLTDPGVATLWIKATPRQIELKPDEVQHYMEEIGAPPAVRRQWDRDEAAALARVLLQTR